MQKNSKRRALRSEYSSPNQLSFSGFETPFYNQLDPTNRWVERWPSRLFRRITFVEQANQIVPGNLTAKKQEKSQQKKDNDDDPPGGASGNKGEVIYDATVCPQDIAYPTDHGLLNKAREITEEIIDVLHGKQPDGKKPRTYR